MRLSVYYIWILILRFFSKNDLVNLGYPFSEQFWDKPDFLIPYYEENFQKLIFILNCKILSPSQAQHPKKLYFHNYVLNWFAIGFHIGEHKGRGFHPLRPRSLGYQYNAGPDRGKEIFMYFIFFILNFTKKILYLGQLRLMCSRRLWVTSNLSSWTETR